MKRLMCICAIVLPACASDALTNNTSDGSTDASSHQDFPVNPQTCDDFANQANQVIANDVVCTVDDDCMNYNTACGMPGECGAAVNAAGQAALASLVMEWNLLKCMGPCPPCAQPGNVACVAGKCQYVPPRPWGAACTKDRQCQTGFCLTTAISPVYINGYCTSPCDQNATCPGDLRCVGDSNGKSYCLVSCMMPSDCRQSDGYSCCSGAGPFKGMGWCAPEKTGFCQAK